MSELKSPSMTVNCSHVIVEMQQAGILSRQDAARAEHLLPPQTADLGSLSTQMVSAGLLTDFQARLIAEGQMADLVLGNYTLLDRLGAGGMGEVYRAVHRRMNRVVAVKILPASVMRDRAAVERFHREVRAAAKLNHPNIVTAHDADESRGTHFLVMELVDGIDLSRLVEVHGPLALSLAVGCILQAACGLKYAHEQRVIHRDIKPSNLLIDSTGRIRILDLGLARFEAEAAADVDDAAPLTQTGSIMGTVDYMAPEQAEDTHTADARSDIYSLGCTLFYLITGRPPYNGSTVIKRLLAHREQPQPDLPDSVPRSLNNIYRRMIAREPADRYQGTTELLTALAECRSAEPTLAEADDSPAGTSPRMAGMAAAAAAAAAVPSTESVETQSNCQHDDDTVLQPAISAASPGHRRWLLPALTSIIAVAMLAGLVLRLQTPAGTVVLEIDDPAASGAVVTVDEQQSMTIAKPGDVPIRIVADGQRHMLKVSKGGFETFTSSFILKAGETRSVRVRLERTGVRSADKEKNRDQVSARAIPEADPTVPVRQDRSLSARHRHVAEVIRKDGGTVRMVPGTSLINSIIYPAEQPPGEQGLELLAGLPTLEFLKAQSISTGQLQQIARVAQLQVLQLPFAGLDDDAVALLAKLQNLRILSVAGSEDITDRSCDVIAEMQGLRVLSLAETSVGDAGIKQLRALPHLRRLALRRCSLTPAGLTALIEFPELNSLELQSCPLDDSAVEQLGKLTTLNLLDLRGTPLTGEGCRRLQEMLPGCVIMHEDLPTSPGEREAARLILSHGGTIRAYPGEISLNQPDRNNHAIRHVKFASPPPAAVWAGIGDCRMLEALYAPGQPRVSDSIRHLSRCRGLLIVDVSNSEISRGDLRLLASLPQLEILLLRRGRLPGVDRSDAALHFRHLMQLDLSDSNAGDQWLETLTMAAPTLEELTLDATAITEAGLKHLAKLPELHRLSLKYLPLSPGAANILSELKLLRILDVTGTRLRPEDVSGLREALPECAVIWNDQLYADTAAPADTTMNSGGSTTPLVP